MSGHSYSTPQGPYPGDAALARLLARARAGMSVAAVKDLVAGALAAPAGFDVEGWIALVVPDAEPELADALKGLKEAMASRVNDGLEAGPPAPAWRLKALRGELARLGLDGFVVPRADEHQGEYVPRNGDRLRWLTGFSGSAGVAIAMAGTAAIFVDGRYTLQVEDQVRTQDWERHHVTESPPAAWIAANLKGGRLGYDPWLHTPAGVRRLEAACAKAGGTLVPVEPNPLDTVWTNRSPAPLAPVIPQATEHAGRAAEEKIAEVCALLAADGQAAAVLSDPASLAWLLNIRGGDVPNTPLALAFGIVEADGRVGVYGDRRKFGPAVEGHLPENVTVMPRLALAHALSRVAADGAVVRIDADTTPQWFAARIEEAGGKVVEAQDPCALPKAAKNAVEIAGTRAAHVRDGAALTTFLAWLDGATRPGSNIEIDELEASGKLEACRQAVPGYRGGSFDTISGAGPNGAVVHYHATARTNRKLEAGSLYLVDSGGQYADGTTDVTRTVSVDEPDEDQRTYFTAVLKGHIALATARFPRGTTGSQLDALARAPLWAIGADFDHGTGHGVGSYLGVHEGPQRISKIGNPTALQPGMIVSNEPGYYRTGAWGIRIENLVVVEEDEGPSERPMLRFSTITRAPIDRRLIDADQLSEAEAAWLDAYHAQVREVLMPLVDSETAKWLEQATRPIAEGA
jgi:Xaa-Pro aminopeptidase